MEPLWEIAWPIFAALFEGVFISIDYSCLIGPVRRSKEKPDSKPGVRA